MASAPRPRSTFWIVSTHVVTTGFLMPLIAMMAIVVVFQNIGRVDMYVRAAIVLGLLSLGYIGGVFYSLSYLRGAAIARNPLACIVPSNVTFAVLAALALGLMIQRFELIDYPILLAMVTIYFVGVTVVFALATRHGFRRMAGDITPRGFEVRPIPVSPISPPPVDPTL